MADEQYIPLSVVREYMPKLNDEDLKELGPVEYDQSKVPEVSKKHAENVRRKVYLQDMTESFARGVEYAGLIASEAVDISNETKGRQDKVESQFNAVQQELTDKDPISAPEIIAARMGEPTLSAKLEKDQQEVNAQLAQTASRVAGDVSVEYEGAVSDGVADDSISFESAILKAPNIIIPWKMQHRITKTIKLEKNQNLDLRGTELLFDLPNRVPAIIAEESAKIHNGSIRVVGQMMGGSGSSLSPITVGNQSTGEGVKGFEFYDLELYTNRNDAGAGITVFGDCSDFSIRDIHFPDNEYMRNGVNIEWGGTSTLGTGHPHDFEIFNITADKLTYNATDYGYLVWLSSVFNADVSNLYAEEIFGLLAVMGGDNSNAYAPSIYKNIVGKNINAKNLSSQNIFGRAARVYGKGKNIAEKMELSASISNLYAKLKEGATSASPGVAFEYAVKSKLDKFEIDGFNVGTSTGVEAEDSIFSNGKIKNSKANGSNVGSVGGGVKGTLISNVEYLKNNSNNGTDVASSVVNISNSEGTKVENCTFGEKGSVETQKYSIYASPDARNPSLANNHTNSIVSGGTAYVIGSSSNTEINAKGINNTAEEGISLHGGAPIFQYGNSGRRTFQGDALPSSGTYKRGDIIYYGNPVANGSVGAVCVESGSPGIWKTFGTISS